MLTLDKVEVGHIGTVYAVKSNNNAILRVMTLGILEQAKFKVLSKTGSGVEILIHNKRIAVSNDIAETIIVV